MSEPHDRIDALEKRVAELERFVAPAPDHTLEELFTALKAKEAWMAELEERLRKAELVTGPKWAKPLRPLTAAQAEAIIASR